MQILKMPSPFPHLSLSSSVAVVVAAAFFPAAFFPSALSHTLPSDIAALRAFMGSIKPSSVPSYSCLASWNFSSDPCATVRATSFVCGLACRSDRVTQLTLDSPGYSGTLSPLVSMLTQLTVIDLSDNKFFGPIPASLFSLPNLQSLSLRSNSFTGSVPSTISSLKSLQFLDVSRNFLSGSLPNSLGSLIDLRHIDVSFNRFAGYLPKLPPSLIEVAVKSNSLSGNLMRSCFDGLTQLEVVELGENSLAETIPGWFFLLPSLQQVDLANNSFTRVEIWKPGNTGSNLVAVDLGFNRIEGYAPANFAAYPLLSALTMSHNKLRGPIPWEYGKKETLKRLFLEGNFLNGSPPAGLFAGGSLVAGDLGDNCLQGCPVSSQLCANSQKPTSICQQAYGGKPKS